MDRLCQRHQFYPCSGGSVAGNRCDLALVVRAVGFNRGVDELVDGSRNTVLRLQPGQRILVEAVVPDQLHQVAHRHAAVEFFARVSGRSDQAVRIVDGRNLFLAKEIEEFLVLIRVGERRSAGRYRGRGDERDDDHRGGEVADSAGKHGRVSVLPIFFADELWQ